MSFDLTPRQEDILRATVDHYVSTAEPVGSKVLARNYSLEISPATIRNVMAVLERTGLLFQPHTSAGRIPSDSGYRHYVDQLIQPSDAIAQQIHQLLTERLQPQKGSLESLLRQAAQILAQCSGCLTLLTLPQATQLNIRHVQLMPVEPRRMMLIVVTDDYSTHSAIIEPDPPENQDSDRCWENLEQELSILSNFLDQHLCGCSIADLNKIDWFELGHEFEVYTHFLQKVGEAIAQELQPQDHPQVIMGGLSKVLEQPEFSELKQAHTLIQLFDLQNADLWPLMWSSPIDSASNASNPITERTKITIKIGTENPLEPIQTCAMISSIYTHRAFSQGRVSVIGPTRMAYEKVIGLVDGTSQYLTQVFCL